MGAGNSGSRTYHGGNALSRHRNLVYRVTQTDDPGLSFIRYSARCAAHPFAVGAFLSGVGQDPGGDQPQAPGLAGAQKSNSSGGRTSPPGTDKFSADALEIQQR